MNLKNLDPDPTTGHEVPVPVLKFVYLVNEWQVPHLHQSEKPDPHKNDADALHYSVIVAYPNILFMYLAVTTQS